MMSNIKIDPWKVVDDLQERIDRLENHCGHLENIGASECHRANKAEARVKQLEHAIIGWWNAGNLEEEAQIVKEVLDG